MATKSPKALNISTSSVGELVNYSSTTKLDNSLELNPEHDYDPFKERNVELPNSDCGSLAHLVKCSLGTGILAMPHAIRSAGLLLGPVVTVLVGVLCAHCVHMLVSSSHILCKRERIPSLTYAGTAELAFRSGPPSLRRLSSAARIFANFIMAATYLSSLCVYLVFIATSIKQVVEHHYPDNVIDIRLYVAMLMPFALALGMIRELKYLVPFSALANGFIVVGFAITLWYTVCDIPPAGDKPYVAAAAELPVFFSTVIFAMEGIGVVMPVENSMRNPGHFLGCRGILVAAMSFVTILYTVVGLLGYLKYGDQTAASITFNLPTEDMLAQVVKLLIAVALLFSYGVQMYIPAEIIWPHVKRRVGESRQCAAHYAMRICIVCGTVCVAAAVPNLGPAISLVGAVCFSTLGLLCPAVVETATCWTSGLGRLRWRLWKNIAITILSLAALVSGTYKSVIEIRDAYAL
ncbi:proton-coupled amino acid transporter-like protein pathetic [Bacillus rossius redtenbacheri]|uniref:proton-coupled amino acid transporter-like protein pathetic n=1 Tax=Bacillus rossius redtenbacheri TaxID=93214 RepID=UPI002FDD1519